MPGAADEDDIAIVNCHTHTFTLDHVPPRFLPYGAGYLLSVVPFRGPIVRFLRRFNPLDPRDAVHRYGNFLEIGGNKDQKDVLETLKGYYPSGTRFIILPMDMAYMGAGLPRVDLHRQHEDLAALTQAPGIGDKVLPFIAVDPRRQTLGGENLVQMIEALLERKRDDGTPVFRGVKLYPPLGYLPTDPALDGVWALCAERGLPVMTHCSRGGVKSKDLPAEVTGSYADPDHYRDVLSKWPNLRVCLAHFGGAGDWQMYFTSGESKEEEDIDAPIEMRRHMNWLTKIMQMLKSKRYPGLYTDISYTVFYVDRYMPALKVFLWNDTLRSRTLFGSDFYMTEQEKFEERYLSMKLRAELGDNMFREIACTNPRMFLGEIPLSDLGQPDTKPQDAVGAVG